MRKETMDRRIYLLPKRGIFYKANLHTHTTLSGGRFTPEQLKEIYKTKGYHILSITDHGIYRDYCNLHEDGFITLPGMGVVICESCTEDMKCRELAYHFNMLDARPDYKQQEKKHYPEYKLGDFESVNQYIETMKKQGFLFCYNHPYWSRQNYRDYKELEGLFAMEIYNHTCENDSLCGYCPQAYDEILRLGKRLWCIATDGNYNQEELESPLSDSFGGFVMVKADCLNRDAITEALKRGDFYSSTGPEIRELYIEGNELVIKTGAVKRIYVILDATLCYSKIAGSEELLTEARFELCGNENYIRVEIIDEYGRYANSNAYFMEDIGYFTDDF